MDSDQRFYLISSKVKKDLESLLGERPLDIAKLSKFAIHYVLPENYRTLVWKVLLGITPRYAESQNYVQQQQKLLYNDLWRALCVLGLSASPEYKDEPLNNVPVDVTSVAHNPEPEHYLFMWLIREGKLLHNPRLDLGHQRHKLNIAISRSLHTFFDDPVEFLTFYCSLWTLLRRHEANILSAHDEAIKALKKREEKLYLHLIQINVLSSGILKDHCLSLFCKIFTESSIVKIIDKVIAGAFDFISYVLEHILDHLKVELSAAESADQVQYILSQLKKEESEHIVHKSLINHINNNNR